MSTLQPAVNAASAATLPAPAAAPTTPAVSAKTWIAVIGATLGAFMAVLNIQIVNASLADIQGAIGAGIDDGGWISTSYLIAEIVVIPLSGWLAQVFSIRIYLLTNAILFLALSAASDVYKRQRQDNHALPDESSRTSPIETIRLTHPVSVAETRLP